MSESAAMAEELNVVKEELLPPTPELGLTPRRSRSWASVQEAILVESRDVQQNYEALLMADGEHYDSVIGILEEWEKTRVQWNMTEQKLKESDSKLSKVWELLEKLALCQFKAIDSDLRRELELVGLQMPEEVSSSEEQFYSPNNSPVGSPLPMGPDVVTTGTQFTPPAYTSKGCETSTACPVQCLEKAVITDKIRLFDSGSQCIVRTLSVRTQTAVEHSPTPRIRLNDQSVQSEEISSPPVTSSKCAQTVWTYSPPKGVEFAMAVNVDLTRNGKSQSSEPIENQNNATISRLQAELDRAKCDNEELKVKIASLCTELSELEREKQRVEALVAARGRGRSFFAPVTSLFTSHDTPSCDDSLATTIPDADDAINNNNLNTNNVKFKVPMATSVETCQTSPLPPFDPVPSPGSVQGNGRTILADSAAQTHLNLTDLNTKMVEMERLTNRNADLDSELKTLRNTLNQSERECETTKAKLEQTKNELKLKRLELLNGNSATLSELRELRTKMEILQKEKAKDDTQLNAKICELRDANQSIVKLTQELTTLKLEKETVDKKKTEDKIQLNAKICELKDAKQSIANLTKELTTLKLEKDTVDKELKSTQSKLEAVERELSQRIENLALAQKGSVDTAAQLEGKNSNLENEKHDLMQKLKDAQQEVENLKEEMTDKDRQIEQFETAEQATYTHFLEENSTLKQQKADIRLRCRELERQNVVLRMGGTLDGATPSKAQRDSLGALDLLRKEVEEKEQEIASLKHELGNKTREKDSISVNMELCIQASDQQNSNSSSESKEAVERVKALKKVNKLEKSQSDHKAQELIESLKRQQAELSEQKEALSRKCSVLTAEMELDREKFMAEESGAKSKESIFIKELKAQIEAVEREKTFVEKTFSEHMIGCSQKALELKAAAEKCHTMTQERNALKECCSELEHQIMQISAKRDQVRRDNISYESQLKELSEKLLWTEKMKQEAEAKFEALKTEKETTRRRCSLLQSELSAAKSAENTRRSLGSASINGGNGDTNGSEMSEENEQLLDELKNAISRRKVAEDTLRMRNREIDALNEENQELVQESRGLALRLSKLEGENLKFQKGMEESIEKIAFYKQKFEEEKEGSGETEIQHRIDIVKLQETINQQKKLIGHLQEDMSTPKKKKLASSLCSYSCIDKEAGKRTATLEKQIKVKDMEISDLKAQLDKKEFGGSKTLPRGAKLTNGANGPSPSPDQLLHIEPPAGGGSLASGPLTPISSTSSQGSAGSSSGGSQPHLHKWEKILLMQLGNKKCCYCGKGLMLGKAMKCADKGCASVMHTRCVGSSTGSTCSSDWETASPIPPDWGRMSGHLQISRNDEPWMSVWALLAEGQLSFYANEPVDVSKVQALESLSLKERKWNVKYESRAGTPILKENDAPYVICINRNELAGDLLNLKMPTLETRDRWLKALEFYAYQYTAEMVAELRCLLSMEVPNRLEINCCTEVGPKLVVGTQEGIYYMDKFRHYYSGADRSYSPVPQLLSTDTLESIHVLEILSFINTVALIVGENRTLAFARSMDLEACIGMKGTSAQRTTRLKLTTMKDFPGCVRLAAFCDHSKTLLAVARGDRVDILKHSKKKDVMVPYQVLEGMVARHVTFLRNGILLIAQGDQFVRVNPDDNSARNFLSSDDGSLARVYQAISSFKDAPQRAIQVNEREVLLAYSNFGFCVDLNGFQSRAELIEWTKPLRDLTIKGTEFLIALHAKSVQIWRIPSNRESHFTRCQYFDLTNAFLLGGLTFLTKKANISNLYRLQFRK